MGEHVCRQAAGRREGLTAGSADVGAVACMGAHVGRQAAGVREGLAAGGADVGAVARMGAHVCHQVAGAREGLAAGGADIGAVAGRDTHVCRQVAAASQSPFLFESLLSEISRRQQERWGPRPCMSLRLAVPFPHSVAIVFLHIGQADPNPSCTALRHGQVQALSCFCVRAIALLLVWTHSNLVADA